jgi:multiple sugar transport system substrate-binding protein/sn-glycerol 3-phosphate transport system substrate-binding protein
MRKVLLLLLVTMVLTAGVTSAQTDIVIPDELPEGITITYWHEWDGAQGEAIEIILNDFNTNNPYGITVEPIAQGNTGGLRDQLTAAITSGSLPNLSGAVFADSAQSYYLDGVIVPLDAYYNHPTWGFTAEEVADLNQDLLDINRIAGEPFNGQLLAWPIGVSSVVMSVNLDMLGELGYDAPPATFEEFREIACAASELTGANGEDVLGFPIRISNFDLYSFVLSNGGQVYDAETGYYTLTNEGFINTLQFFQDLYNDGCAYIPETPFQNTLHFAYGLNPMAVGSSVGVPFIRTDMAASVEAGGSEIANWTNTTTPWTEGNRTLQVSMRSIGMMVSSPEQQLATWLFIKHMASAPSQVTWTEYAQYQPYTTSGLEALTDEWLAENPQFANVRELLLGGEVTVWSPPAIPVAADVNNIINELITNVLTGGADVAEAAAAADEAAREVIDEMMADM